MSRSSGVETGVCIIRAELEPYGKLRITVTTRSDVQRADSESSFTSANIDFVIAQVHGFLTA